MKVNIAPPFHLEHQSTKQPVGLCRTTGVARGWVVNAPRHIQGVGILSQGRPKGAPFRCPQHTSAGWLTRRAIYKELES